MSPTMARLPNTPRPNRQPSSSRKATTAIVRRTDPAPIAARASRPAQVLAFSVPVALILYYALRGGSYDIVVRDEEALAVWWLVGLGYAFGILPRARPPRSVAVPLVALLLLAIWTATGLHWSESSER